jgi:tetratricopeptide (TPR) repeat protein
MPRATTVLERAVRLDPAQLVANRLLVEAYLGADRVDKARERLDLYRDLNLRDPDIGALEARVGVLGGVTRPLPAPSRGAGFRASSDAIVVPRLDAPAVAPRDEATVRSTASSFEPEPPAVPAASTGLRAEQPFLTIHGADAARRIVTRFAASGIFPVAALRPAARRGPAPVAVPVPAGERAAAPAAPVRAPEPTFELSPEPGIESLPAAEEIPIPAVAAPPRPASSTLGGLYMAQGHLDDAEQSFEAVLEARPADEEARAGLAEVRRRKVDAAKAFFLDAPEPEEMPGAVVGGLTARKIDVLRQFMSRMRRGSQPHVS